MPEAGFFLDVAFNRIFKSLPSLSIDQLSSSVKKTASVEYKNATEEQIKFDTDGLLNKNRKKFQEIIKKIEKELGLE